LALPIKLTERDLDSDLEPERERRTLVHQRS